MIAMICVDCGEEKEIFRNGSCLSCYLKTHQFTKGPDVFTILHCVHCDSYKYKNLWYLESFENILKRYITQYFSISHELEHISIAIQCDETDEYIKSCLVDITGELDGHIVKESHTIEIRIKNHVCEVCSKQFGGYHEAIIQIRPDKKKLSDEKLDELLLFVEDHIISLQKRHTNLFLADMGREHGGLDFYLSDKQAAFSIVKKLQETYGGYITTSSKNIGMKDGRQIYRDTYLLRLLPFDVEDILRINGVYFFVEKISKNTIHLFNLEKDEHSIHEASDIEDAIVFSGKDFIKDMIVVNQKEHEVQVMDQKSYRIYVVRKSKNQDVVTDILPILFIDEEHIYLYPSINQK
jgi:nonsense-mediated mRNA decay protein 3